MKGFPFYLFTNLFRSANRFSNSGDNPQLTNFLKNNQIFRNLAWKIHDTKHKVVKSVKEAMFKDEPQNKNRNKNK
jgi:hypothetical protein